MFIAHADERRYLHSGTMLDIGDGGRKESAPFGSAITQGLPDNSQYQVIISPGLDKNSCIAATQYHRNSARQTRKYSRVFEAPGNSTLVDYPLQEPTLLLANSQNDVLNFPKGTKRVNVSRVPLSIHFKNLDWCKLGDAGCVQLGVKTFLVDAFNSWTGLRVRVGSEEQKGTDLACDATESPGMWMPRTVNYIPPTNFADGRQDRRGARLLGEYATGFLWRSDDPSVRREE
ncbi:hypothetical protein CPB85DRAFT_1459783 [Mucidula mucida]|nr:hypothetical protein CPB85DRAFT_1459783 [Mucidula mucida]